MHTNLYNAERPYSDTNAVMPLEKIESEFTAKQKAGLSDRLLSEIKTSAAFGTKNLILGTAAPQFYAKPSFALVGKRGISMQDKPDNVDVAFDATDQEKRMGKYSI